MTGARGGLAAAALAAALGIRLLAGLSAPSFEPLHPTDPWDYDRHAVSIAAGQGFPSSVLARGGGPTAFRPPLYPYLLGGVYALAGPGPGRWEAGLVAQAVLGTIAVGLIGWIALLLWGWGPALLALALAAAYPPLFVWGTMLMSEPLFLVVELGALGAALAYRRSRRPGWAALAGALTGLAILTRVNGIALIPPVALAVWLPPRRRRAAILPVGIVLAATVAVLAPWEIRNALVFHRVVPLSTQVGTAAAGTYNEEARTDASCKVCWRGAVHLPEYRAVMLDTSIDEATEDALLRHRVGTYIRAHPTYPVSVAFWNSLRMFGLLGPGAEHLPSGSPPPRPVLADASAFGFYLFAPLALIGLGTRMRRAIPGGFWVLPPLVALSAVPVYASSRYRVPIEPFVVLLAAAALVTTWRRRASRRASAPPPEPPA